MTTHEKTRLIELLCSGDEANILLAKEICEQQGLISCIKQANDYLQRKEVEVCQDGYFYTVAGFLKKDKELDEQYSKFCLLVFGYDNKGIDRQSNKYRKKRKQYYAQHLQSSE